MGLFQGADRSNNDSALEMGLFEELQTTSGSCEAAGFQGKSELGKGKEEQVKLYCQNPFCSDGLSISAEPFHP